MEAVHLKNTSSYLKALQYTKDFGFDPRLTIPTRGFSMSYRQAFQKAAFDHHPHSRKPCGSIAQPEMSSASDRHCNSASPPNCYGIFRFFDLPIRPMSIF